MSKLSNAVTATLENLVEQAINGDKKLLEEIVRRIQDRIYGLALRMLYIPADAEDATQEILIKIITRLGTFKGESRFETWVYSIASNHLLTMRKGRAERWQITMEQCDQMIAEGVSDSRDATFSETEQRLVVEETKRACVHYLLLCLNRELRLAVILGMIIGVNNTEGAAILGVGPVVYRQRLSRGRRQLINFLVKRCGLVDAGSPCHCETLAALHVRKKHIDPENLFFVTHPCRSREDGRKEDLLQEMDQLTRANMLIRNQPDYAAPGVFVKYVKKLIDSGTFQLLA